MSKRYRQCVMCNEPFEFVSPTQKYCGDKCKKRKHQELQAEKIIKICKRCACEYLIRRSSAKKKRVTGLCQSCISNDRSTAAKAKLVPHNLEGRHNKLYTKKAPKIKIKAPCATCIHGVVNQASDIGWMCRANAMICRPLAGKNLYTARPA